MKINETFDVISYLNSNEQNQFNFKQPPCIEELKTILETDVAKTTGARQKLADKMKQDVIDKLLQPGVSTNHIINFYIQAIRVFKYIDPSTILLEIVTQPVKQYLRSRKNTLRCIVQIISDERKDLYQQLGNQQVQIHQNVQNRGENLAEDGEGYISTDDDEAAAEKWEPIPINQIQQMAVQGNQGQIENFDVHLNDLSHFISAKRRQSDIISTLVNIYGS